jgi:Zn-dependent M28 family amino/carboxypeptidase
VTGTELKEWVSFLSSDQMKGRRNGSPEMKQAADWIEKKFLEAGLKPVDTTGNFIQEYSYMAKQGLVNERNVIGFIEGSDPELKNEYIIVSAHFDHIGIKKGNPVDSVYNGADDNASGTCTIAGIARNIKESGLKPGRSIIFAAFSGEESGMKGSGYFVSNCPVLVQKIYADLNFEMTGHSEGLGKRKYYMTGCSRSNLDNVITEYEKNSKYQLIDTLGITEMLFGASDNISFSRMSVQNGISTGVPSGTFATSTIPEYLHSVSDEASLFDFENMSEMVEHFTDVVLMLSNSKETVSWTDPNFVRP